MHHLFRILTFENGFSHHHPHLPECDHLFFLSLSTTDINDEAPTSPTTPPQNNALSCINCNVKKTPLWRMKGMERYCNACSL
jgi:hypothetical protein